MDSEFDHCNFISVRFCILEPPPEQPRPGRYGAAGQTACLVEEQTGIYVHILVINF